MFMPTIADPNGVDTVLDPNTSADWWTGLDNTVGGLAGLFDKGKQLVNAIDGNTPTAATNTAPAKPATAAAVATSWKTYAIMAAIAIAAVMVLKHYK